MDDAHSISPGRRTFGDFELIRPLGQGASSTVWEARQVSLDRIVALKLLHSFDSTSPERRDRFRREAAALARVAHPGIVPLLEHGEEDGVPYVVLERILGCDLASALRAVRLSGLPRGAGRTSALDRIVAERAGVSPQGAFSGEWTDCIARISREIANALDHAHRCQVLHRDLKPSNVLLTPEGRVWLADFGVAVIDGDDPIGEGAGSIPYLAPERLRGVGASRSSEIYSLGVVLHELLYLERPFDGDDPGAVMRAIETGTKAATFQGAVSRRARDGGRNLDAIMRKAMARDPSLRYRSARDLARDLDAFLGRRPITARREGLAGELWRWAKRHRTSATVLGSAIGLAFVLPTAIQWQRLVTAQRVADSGHIAAEHLRLSVDAIDRMLVSSDRLGPDGYSILDPKRVLLHETALDLYEELGELETSPAQHRSLEAARTRALVRLASMEDGLRGQDALERLDGALELVPAAYSSDMDRTTARAQIALSRGSVLFRLGEPERALTVHHEAIDLLDSAGDTPSGRAVRIRLRTNLLQGAANSARMLGRIEESLQLASSAIETIRTARAANESAAGSWVRIDLANSLNTLGAMHLEAADWDAATETCREALRVLERTRNTPRAELTRALAHDNLGIAATRRGDRAVALRHFDAAGAIHHRELVESPRSTRVRFRGLRSELNRLIATRMNPKLRSGTLESGLELEARVRSLRDEVPDSREFQELLVGVLRSVASDAMLTADRESQLEITERAFTESERSVAMNPDRVLARTVQAAITSLYCQALVFVAGDIERALPLIRRTVAIGSAEAIVLRDQTALLVFCGLEIGNDPQRDEDARVARRKALMLEALAVLTTAVERGYADVSDLEENSIFRALRWRPEFGELIERARDSQE